MKLMFYQIHDRCFIIDESHESCKGKNDEQHEDLPNNRDLIVATDSSIYPAPTNLMLVGEAGLGKTSMFPEQNGCTSTCNISPFPTHQVIMNRISWLTELVCRVY